MSLRRYALRPDLGLLVRGERPVLRHFDAEYRERAVGYLEGGPQLEVTFGKAAAEHGATSPETGGHKSVRWRVALSEPDGAPLHAGLELGGRPLSFALSLVQGYFVEPVLSVAAAAQGYVLVPAAALAGRDGAVLLMGRSGSGKSSLSARALAAGQAVLGDDQVLIDRGGGLYAYPRRMRFYSDLSRTAPGAYRRLRAPARAGLVGRGAVRALTRGYVAPPIRLSPRELGPPSGADRVPLTRVIVVERGGESNEIAALPLEPEVAVALTLELLDEQRAHLRRFDGGWPAALSRTRAAEEDSLREAFAGVPIERLSVPAAWDSRTAIDELAERIGVGG
jgi:hypothetical protein